MNNIRDYRKRKGLTLKQLGKIIGVAESTLSKYENGVNEPDLGTLALIADTLSASVDELLGRAETKQEKKESVSTIEAKLISAGVDKMPEADREKALNMMKLMFAEYSNYFEKGNNDDT